ncbi:hypothetical protein G7Y89_g6389 [Cudoniella acicularis]|uniref:Uncharacterized protein n=1 Tax=Cudoniella acicularis TaxID=354080 RepID=A0A8H4RMV1_9HELO|nr:hypothetical protein G7Y89_g6389 [Cudoniella acicularis]
MSDSDEEQKKKRAYRTDAARIEQIFERYGREPTVNELRALDALPLKPEKDLWDVSASGRRIFDLLKRSELYQDVSLLEEAGQLLWEQIFQRAPPVPTDGYDQALPQTSSRSRGFDYAGISQECSAISNDPFGKIVIRKASKSNIDIEPRTVSRKVVGTNGSGSGRQQSNLKAPDLSIRMRENTDLPTPHLSSSTHTQPIPFRIEYEQPDIQLDPVTFSRNLHIQKAPPQCPATPSSLESTNISFNKIPAPTFQPPTTPQQLHLLGIEQDLRCLATRTAQTTSDGESHNIGKGTTGEGAGRADVADGKTTMAPPSIDTPKVAIPPTSESAQDGEVTPTGTGVQITSEPIAATDNETTNEDQSSESTKKDEEESDTESVDTEGSDDPDNSDDGYVFDEDNSFDKSQYRILNDYDEQSWWDFYREKAPVIVIALAKLILDKNREAREANGEPTIIGKNLDLKDKNILLLYHYYNVVCAELAVNKKEQIYSFPDDELPPGFRVASKDE